MFKNIFLNSLRARLTLATLGLFVLISPFIITVSEAAVVCSGGTCGG